MPGRQAYYRCIDKLAPNVNVMLVPSGSTGGTPVILDMSQLLGSQAATI